MSIVQRVNTMRIIREWWYALFVCILLCSYATLYSDMRQWRIAIGESSTRSFGAELGSSEFTDFFGGITWFRQAPQGSDIGIPRVAVPRIITVRIITRGDDAPSAIQLQSARLRIDLPTSGQLRRYSMYVPADQTVRITCDTTQVTSPYLQSLCAAVVDVRGYTPQHIAGTSLWWVFVLPIVLWMWLAGIVCHRFGATSLIRFMILSMAGVLAWYVLTQYPLQSAAWALGISIWLSGVIILFWVFTNPQRNWHWVWGVMIIAVALRLMIYSAPGADGVDRKVHARQLESVIYGDIYLENVGTIVSDAAQPRRVQTYPYPPAVYLLLAPVMLFVSPVMTFNYYVGAMALLLDATLVFAVVWLLIQQRLGETTAWYSAIVLLFFPQAYVFHSYPVVAQALAQWASWWFVCMTLMVGDVLTFRQRMLHGIFALIAITGHFGAFLTMSVMQCIQWLLGHMRRAAWLWIGMAILLSVIYYSQYVVLILDQSDNLVQSISQSRIDAFFKFWNGGVNDHYSWVVFVLGILGTTLPRLQSRPALRYTLWAGVATTTVLAILRVVFFINPTRIVIFIAPIIAIGMGLMANEYRRHRAGAVMMTVLCAYFAYISLTAWMTINIDQQLVRWVLPQ